MNIKLSVVLLMILLPILTFSNAISNVTTDIDFTIGNNVELLKNGRRSKSEKRHERKIMSGVTMSFLGNNMIIYSVPMTVLSYIIISNIGSLYDATVGSYKLSERYQNPFFSILSMYMSLSFIIGILGAVITTVLSAGFFLGGIALSILGFVNFKKVQSPQITAYIERRSTFFGYTALITGLLSAVGSVFGGIGASLLVYNYYTGHSDSLQETGTALSIIGGICLFSFPFTITSLGYRAWLKGVKAELSFDGGLNKSDSLYLSFNVRF